MEGLDCHPFIKIHGVRLLDADTRFDDDNDESIANVSVFSDRIIRHHLHTTTTTTISMRDSLVIAINVAVSSNNDIKT